MPDTGLNPLPMSGFRIDTHVHTAEVSPCADIPARLVVQLYKEAGYDGIVVTDHYNEWVFESFGLKSWPRICARYLSGYEAARMEGERVGLVVLPGMEITFPDDGYADFLVFGLDPEFLYHYPELYRLGLRRFRTLVQPLGCLIYQAHPFRPGITVADPALLDGVEVYNGNPSHLNRNRQAADFARKHGLSEISGSDFHHSQNLARGGIVLPERVTDPEGLAQVLRANRAPPLIQTEP